MPQRDTHKPNMSLETSTTLSDFSLVCQLYEEAALSVSLYWPQRRNMVLREAGSCGNIIIIIIICFLPILLNLQKYDAISAHSLIERPRTLTSLRRRLARAEALLCCMDCWNAIAESID